MTVAISALALPAAFAQIPVHKIMRIATSLLPALAVFISTFSSVAAPARIDARMMRQPDVSATQIAFVYAGDIWVAPKAGGEAVRLSSPRGEESFPKFSPDGSLIAFSGNYDGNTDVYVMPATGGVGWDRETFNIQRRTPKAAGHSAPLDVGS